MTRAIDADNAQQSQTTPWREFETNNDPDLLERVLASSIVQNQARDALRAEMPFAIAEGPVNTIILTPGDRELGDHAIPAYLFSSRKMESWSDEYTLGLLSVPEMLSIRERYTDQPIGERIYIATDRARLGHVFSIGMDSGSRTYLHIDRFLTGDSFNPKDKILYRLVPKPVGERKMKVIYPENVGPVAFLNDDGHIRTLKDVEADMIRFALSHYRGRKSEVIRRLGLSRSGLYRRLDDYGIPR